MHVFPIILAHFVRDKIESETTFLSFFRSYPNGLIPPNSLL